MLAFHHTMRDGLAPHQVTKLLQRWREGDNKARDQLIELVYPELQRLARKYLRSERGGHTLSATALVHEAYVRLAGADVDWNDRAHFFAVAAQIMRRVLVDYGNRRRRQKRGGVRVRITLEENLLPAEEPAADIVAVDEALKRLAETDQRQCRVVELSFFGGMSYEEVAEVLGISPNTVKRELRFAKAWLSVELSPTAASKT